MRPGTGSDKKSAPEKRSSEVVFSFQSKIALIQMLIMTPGLETHSEGKNNNVFTGLTVLRGLCVCGCVCASSCRKQRCGKRTVDVRLPVDPCTTRITINAEPTFLGGQRSQTEGSSGCEGRNDVRQQLCCSVTATELLRVHKSPLV